MTVTKITTHKEDAKNRLLQQYKGKTNLENLIDSLNATQIQALEDALFTVYGKMDIDNAVGAQLDGIGSIVGQSRQGFSDDTYRLLIKAAIGRNTSEGDIEKVLSVWSLFTGSSAVQLTEFYPADMTLASDNGVDPSLIDILFALIQDVVSAGVSVSYVSVFPPVGAFGFDGSGSDTEGFSDTASPTLGGKFASVQASV